MNREIKYRGQSVDSKVWVYGSLIILTTGYYIVPIDTYYNEINIDLGEETTVSALWEGNDFHEVIPETVGQYTGLKDKNNVEIYEHDILRITIYDMYGKIVVNKKCKVIFQDGGFGVLWGHNKSFTNLNAFYNYKFEVIGNIYENKDLLSPYIAEVTNE